MPLGGKALASLVPYVSADRVANALSDVGIDFLDLFGGHEGCRIPRVQALQNTARFDEDLPIFRDRPLCGSCRPLRDCPVLVANVAVSNLVDCRAHTGDHDHD